MKPNNQDNLESAVHRALRSIPDRRAPASLEGRVLRELSRRAALPWWRKSYIHWPVPVRVLFFAGSAVTAALVVTALSPPDSQRRQHLAGDVAHRFEWLFIARSLVEAIVEKGRLVVGAIPPLWLFGGLGIIAALYGTLVAIGAATYRTLTSARLSP